MRKYLKLLLVLALMFVDIQPVNAFYNNSESMSCVIELIENATKTYTSTINVKKCRISTSELNAYFWEASAGSIARDLISGFTYKYSGSYVDSVVLKYRYDRTSTAKILTKYQELADNLIASLDPQMSDLDKLFYLHNYLALHTEYDMEAADDAINTGSSVVDSKYALSFSTVGPLFNGKAVCSGYSQAYLYLLNRLGIEAKYLTSTNMNHGWNIVKYNGNWYHVDITYDDPVPDLIGYVDYKYFMKNDAQMSEDHTWDDHAIAMNSMALTSEEYIFNKPINDAFYFDGYWYYVLNGEIWKSKIDGKDASIINSEAHVVDMYMINNIIYYTTSINGYYLNGVYLTNANGDYAMEITKLANGMYREGLYYENGYIQLVRRDGTVEYIEMETGFNFVADLIELSFTQDTLNGKIDASYSFYDYVISLEKPLQIMFDGEKSELYFDLSVYDNDAYYFTIPFDELYDDVFDLKIVYGNSIYDMNESSIGSIRYEGLDETALLYENELLSVKGIKEYVEEVEEEFDYSPYGNGLFPIYANSRVTHLNMYGDHTLHISGYALEQFNNYNKSYSFVRELVLVEMTTGLEYRIGLNAVYNPFLNNNLTLNPNGEYDYSYAFYDSTIDFNDVLSYWDKEPVALPKGTYRMFIRLSDGKRSNVISLQNTKSEEVQMPRNFFIIDGTNDVGMNYGV